MVDKWGNWVHNFTTPAGSKKNIRMGLTIVPHVFSDRIDFYLGVDFEAEYEIKDASNEWRITGNWTRGWGNVLGGVDTPSGGGTQVLWSEAVSSGHLYRVTGSPGETKTASATASIRNLFQLNKTATVTYSESATIPAIVPDAPKTVTSTPGNGIVSITYTAPDYNGGATISKYQYSTDNATWTDTPSNPFNVSGTNGTSKTVYIRAVNSAGGGASKSATSTPRTVPTVVQSMTATPGVREVVVDWATPASNGGASISRYDVYRLRWNGSSWVESTLIYNQGETVTTATGLANNQLYLFHIYAINAAGASPVGEVTATTPNLPGSVSGLSANSSTFGVVGLSWTASSTTAGYTVTYTVSRGGTTLGTTTNTTFNDTTVAPSTGYTYTVTPSNAVGTVSGTTVSATSLGGIVRVWNGTNWTTQVALVKVWNGSSWTLAQARVWDGNQWKYGI
jgi:hypothetical protein